MAPSMATVAKGDYIQRRQETVQKLQARNRMYTQAVLGLEKERIKGEKANLVVSRRNTYSSGEKEFRQNFDLQLVNGRWVIVRVWGGG